MSPSNDEALWAAIESLARAEQALASGTIVVCLLSRLLSDILRFRRTLSELASAAVGIVANDAVEVRSAVLSRITSYGLYVSLLAAKSEAMQVLFYFDVANRGNLTHLAVDCVGAFSKSVPPQDPARPDEKRSILVYIENSIDTREGLGQLELLAYLSRLHDGVFVPDQLVLALEAKLKVTATESVRAGMKRMPDWYAAEIDLSLVRGDLNDMTAISMRTKELVSVRAVQPFAKRNASDIVPFSKSVVVWRALSHENVCALVAANHLASPHMFVVTEKCERLELSTIACRGRAEKLKILLQAAEGLAAIHANGVVHGDVRSENLFLTTTLLKVGGLHHCFKQEPSSEAANQADKIWVTRSTRWLAPECLRGGIPTLTSDVYAFGLTVYEVLTGWVPFAQWSDDAVTAKKKEATDSFLPDQAQGKIEGDTWLLVRDACRVNPLYRPSMQLVVMMLRSMIGRTPEELSARPVPSANSVLLVANETAAAPTTSGQQDLDTAAATELKSSRVEPIKISTPRQALAGNKIVPLPQLDVTHLTPVKAEAAVVVAPRDTACDQVKVAPRRRCCSRWRMFFFLIVAASVSTAVVFVSRRKDTVDSGLSPTPTPTPATTTLPTPVPTPTTPLSPTTPAPLVGSRVSTITRGFAASELTSITVYAGEVYVSDQTHVYNIGDNKLPVRFAGSDPTDGSTYENGFRTDAVFGQIRAIAFDVTTGDLYIADAGNKKLRKVRGKDGLVVDVAGVTGLGRFIGKANSVAMPSLTAIAVDMKGDVYAADSGAVMRNVRKLTTSTSTVSIHIDTMAALPTAIVMSDIEGKVQTFVAQEGMVAVIAEIGSVVPTPFVGSADNSYTDGVGNASSFGSISGLAYVPSKRVKGTLYIVDKLNHCIRKVDVATANVTTFAGLCTESGLTDGHALVEARFVKPHAIAMSADYATMYAIDGGTDFYRVRKITMI